MATGKAWHAGRVSALVLFDLDGTLTDSAPGIVTSLRYALDALGLEHPDDATLRSFLGPPMAVTLRSHFGLSEPDIQRAIAKYRERYHDVGLFENEVYAGIPENLQTLTARGTTLATATSKSTMAATRILDYFNLTQYFAFIGGAALDGSREAKADVVSHTIAQFPNHTARIMIGDRKHDVHGAKAHGIRTIGVSWGYGDHDELLTAGAIEVVDSPSDIPPRVHELLREEHSGVHEVPGVPRTFD
jgi:phosphoglycolate phosphatase